MVSAEVVNFSTLRRPALVMNSHHLRVAHRIGLTPRADARRTEELLLRQLPESWDADRLLVRESDPAALNARLVAGGVRVMTLSPERHRLEDVVLAATTSGSDRFGAGTEEAS